MLVMNTPEAAMTLRHEIERAIKAGNLEAAQQICDEMTGAQAHNWQVKLDRLMGCDCQHPYQTNGHAAGVSMVCPVHNDLPATHN